MRGSPLPPSRDQTVVTSAVESRGLEGATTGKDLIDVLQSSPHHNVDIEPDRFALLVSDVTL